MVIFLARPLWLLLWLWLLFLLRLLHGPIMFSALARLSLALFHGAAIGDCRLLIDAWRRDRGGPRLGAIDRRAGRGRGRGRRLGRLPLGGRARRADVGQRMLPEELQTIALLLRPLLLFLATFGFGIDRLFLRATPTVGQSAQALLLHPAGVALGNQTQARVAIL